MSLAWYVVLEREIPGSETFINGKALGHAGELLDSIAQEIGVLPLSRFFSIPREEWFLPEQGLRTLRSLMEAAANRRVSDEIIKDLRDFQAVLQIAEANGVRWHLAVDF